MSIQKVLDSHLRTLFIWHVRIGMNLQTEEDVYKNTERLKTQLLLEN